MALVVSCPISVPYPFPRVTSFDALSPLGDLCDLLLSEYPVSSLLNRLRDKSAGFDYKVFLLGFSNECS